MKLTEEMRRSSRRKQLKAGLITSDGRHSTIPCRVRDISDEGARLEIEDGEPPDAFRLVIDYDGLEASCDVVWRRGKTLGVRFTSPPKIAQRARPSIRRTPLT